jgi:hypothetical protein
MAQTELTRKEANRFFLANEKYSDLTLRGTDGALVRVNRAMLATRCPVFDTMLFGDFAEASQSVVDIGYTGETLRDIVSYLYIDEAPILTRKESSDEDSVRKVLCLMEGATYFVLPELRRKAEAFAVIQMDKHPSLCVAYFAALETHDSQAAVRMEKHAFEKLRLKPEIILEDGVPLTLLSSSRIEKVLTDQKLFANELTVFRILQAWSTVDEEHQRIATELTKCVIFENIDPYELSTRVKNSCLVTREQLYDAYKAQALSHAQQPAIFYKKMRIPTWKSSNDVTYSSDKVEPSTDLLQCPALSSGIHKWSILVEEFDELDNLVRMGVVSTVHPLDTEKKLGDQAGGWQYRNDGHVRCNGVFMGVKPTFGKGSTVAFILDLTGDGTLSASVDGMPAAQLFSNMLSKFEGYWYNEKGFVPAVSLCRLGRVRFLGFD